MYPVLRLMWQFYLHRNSPRLPLTGTHVSHHICMPWDIDLWRELNNGRTLTIFDLGRIPLAGRVGLIGALKRNRWGLSGSKCGLACCPGMINSSTSSSPCGKHRANAPTTSCSARPSRGARGSSRRTVPLPKWGRTYAPPICRTGPLPGSRQMPHVLGRPCRTHRNSLRKPCKGCHIPLKPKGLGHGRHIAAQADLGLVFL